MTQNIAKLLAIFAFCNKMLICSRSEYAWFSTNTIINGTSIECEYIRSLDDRTFEKTFETVISKLRLYEVFEKTEIKLKLLFTILLVITSFQLIFLKTRLGISLCSRLLIEVSREISSSNN